MADVANLICCAFERVLDTFEIESLRDLQPGALEKLVNVQDVLVIQPTGSGKSMIFQSATHKFGFELQFSNYVIDKVNGVRLQPSFSGRARTREAAGIRAYAFGLCFHS